jgi:uncharacterized protein YbjT (DUF2867 family)
MTAPAFVLGATGFVGREVVRQLCLRGVPVFAHVRPDSARLADWKERFGALGATVDTTAWDATTLGERLREIAPAQLYILIGTTREKARSENLHGDIYERIDLGLTQLAVEAARRSGTHPRLVYLSSIGANASARSRYLRARGKAEQAVMGSGLPWVIARPAVITGARDEPRHGERAAAVIGDGLLAIAGVLGGAKLRARYRSTTADVLASALIRLGEAPEHDRIVDGAGLR